MPHATKDQDARPFDVADAIRRAAQCRAMRQTAGLTIEELARAAGVRSRSVDRWENASGAGCCPDDVLRLLDRILTDQRRAVDAAAARACAARDAARRGARADGYQGGAVPSDLDRPAPPGRPVGRIAAPAARRVRRLGASMPTIRNDGHGKADSMPGGGGDPIRCQGGAPARFHARDARRDSTPFDSMPCDAMPFDVVVRYWPSQRAYDELRGDGGSYGVENATARATAIELERLGFNVVWRYHGTD